MVSNLASGRPRLGPLQRTLELIGTLRQREHDGSLTVVASPEVTTIGATETGIAGSDESDDNTD